MAHAASQLGCVAGAPGACLGGQSRTVLPPPLLLQLLRSPPPAPPPPPPQGINMSIVPLPYRVLFVNVASLFWSAFLSNMANAKAAAPPAALGDVPVAAGTGKADEAKKKAEL